MAGDFNATSLTRRGVFAGALLAAGVAHGALAAPAASNRFLAYEQKLRARLADAGGGRFDAYFSQALLSEVNGFRADQGLGAYQWDEDLAACARAHAADMASRDYFAHPSPEGFTHLDRVALLARDLCGSTAENLAWREDPRGSTPGQFQQLWENSPGHRKNLLRETYTRAGYGVVRINNAYYAAGVYADASLRLSRPLPLSLETGRDLAGALDGAGPDIRRLAVTAPFQQPTWSTTVDKMPVVQPGTWQLRPLHAAGGNSFDVLTGPLFVVL